MLQYIKLYSLWKDVRQNINDDKNWYKSKEFFDSAIALGAKCLSSFFEVEVSEETKTKMSNNLLGISLYVNELIPIVSSVIKEIKNKKMEEK